MNHLKFIFLSLLFVLSVVSAAQEVPITAYSTNENGQVLLEVASDLNNYYILRVRHNTTDDFKLATSIVLGEAGTTIISEPLESYPLEHYQVLQYQIAAPFDIDGDGEDDISEFYNRPTQSPLNFASPVSSEDGLVSIQDMDNFRQLSVEGIDVPWAPFLNGREFVKFSIVDVLSDNPKIYFINTNIYERHHWFYNAIGIDYINGDVLSGEIIYHPLEVSSNGTIGTFSFAYSQGFGDTFEIIQTNKTSHDD